MCVQFDSGEGPKLLSALLGEKCVCVCVSVCVSSQQSSWITSIFMLARLSSGVLLPSQMLCDA